jgi:hypothetical protein
MEDIAGKDKGQKSTGGRPVVNVIKRKRVNSGSSTTQGTESTTLTQSWREVLGSPPPYGTTKVCNCVYNATMWIGTVQNHKNRNKKRE